MRKLFLKENSVFFQSAHIPYSKDTNWKLDIDSIMLIGIVNRLKGDDDSTALVFIDKNLAKFFIDMSLQFDGNDILFKTIKERFGVDIENEFYKNADIDNYLIFPKSLYKQPIYESSFYYWVRRLLDCIHFADGKLKSSYSHYVQDTIFSSLAQGTILKTK